MGIRESMSKKPAVAAGASALLVLVAAVVIARSYWPEKKGDLLQTLYSDDDGQTWFADSIYRVAPFDHNGKTGVMAQVYTYDDGKKQFCGYLSEFTPEAKKELDAALADAKMRGQDPGTVSLYQNRSFMNQTLVKLPGPGHPWIASSDPKSRDVLSVHSPDGSAMDLVVGY
jgi:hypothetical protein